MPGPGNHPEATSGLAPKRFSEGKGEEFLNKIISEVSGDEDARQTWLNRQQRYYKRRYCRVGRNTGWPWKGASDIVMPTIDMTVDRIKASLLRVIFTRPMVDIKARNPRSLKRVLNVRKFFDWLVNEGIPDFRKQISIGLDYTLQYGFCTFKIFWDYRTVKRTKVFRRNALMREVEGLLEALALLGGAEFSDEAVSEEVQVERFRKIIAENQEAVIRKTARKYGLDPKIPEDADALSKILAFLMGAKSEVSVEIRERVANNPRVLAMDPTDLVVPRGTHDIADAARITNKIFLTESEFRLRAHDRNWDKEAVAEVLRRKRARRDELESKGAPDRTSFETDKDQREGISSLPDDEFLEIWEQWRWMEMGADKRPRRVKMTIHPGTKEFLAKPTELADDHGKWPFAVMRFELNDPRFHSSRGIPEKIDDIDKEITHRHRNKLNNMDLTFPMLAVRMGSRLNPRTFQAKPGRIVPVSRPDDVTPIIIPDRTSTDEREENVLRTWVQDYLGSSDAGLSDRNTFSERPTATEVRALQQNAVQRLSSLGELIQMTMKEIYGQVWDLWQQWGPKEVFIRVTGGRLESMSRFEIQGDFDMIPVGTVTSTDPELESQKALQRLNVITTMIEKFQTKDFLGIEYEVKLDEAVLSWMLRDNMNDASAIIRERTPEEIEKIVQAQKKAQEEAEAERQRRLQEGISSEEAREEVSRLQQQVQQGNALPFRVKAGNGA